MSWRWTALAVGFIAVGTVAGVLLMLPASTPAQAPPTPAAPQPTAAGYVGSETCKGCHEDQWNKFAPTKMGRLMLQHPRSAKEGMWRRGAVRASAG
jgi:hypothetical protein